jgi:hypothetical protein
MQPGPYPRGFGITHFPENCRLKCRCLGCRKVAIIPPSLIGEQGCLSVRKEAPVSKQSSVAVVARALVMLACIVAIPAFALSGSSWSEIVKKLREFDASAVWNQISANIPGSGTKNEPAASQRPVEPAQTKTEVGTASNSVSGGAIPQNLTEPAPVFISPVATALPTQPATASAVVPAAYQSPSEPSDQFISVEHRLRKLGATYYLLETWGNQQQMYRFYCKMAIGGSTEFTRYFEATHGEPLQAMLDVLRQVEAWKSGK